MTNEKTYIITLTEQEVKMFFVVQLMAHAADQRPESDPFYWKYKALLARIEAVFDAVMQDEEERHD